VTDWHRLRLFSSVRPARLIALILLAFVSWGTTAEVTHHHQASRATLSANSSSAADLNGSDELKSTDQQTNSSTSKSRAECLICQLHQNLSTTLVTQAPALAAAETKSFRAPTALSLRLSEYRSDRSGRAPPSIL
jgi:hypothetical protein